MMLQPRDCRGTPLGAGLGFGGYSGFGRRAGVFPRPWLSGASRSQDVAIVAPGNYVDHHLPRALRLHWTPVFDRMVVDLRIV